MKVLLCFNATLVVLIYWDVLYGCNLIVGDFIYCIICLGSFYFFVRCVAATPANI